MRPSPCAPPALTSCADESTLKQRDSSIKRNTTTIRKLRSVTEESAPALLRELRSLNLSKYVTEAAAALAESRLKPNDVWAACELACELHQSYAEFGSELGAALGRLIPPPTATQLAALEGEKAEPPSPLQRRLKLRLLTELLLLRAVPDAQPLTASLKELCADCFSRDKETFQTNLTLFAAFAKHSPAELLGLSPAEAPPAPDGPVDAAAAAAQAALAALPPRPLAAEKQAALLALVTRMYDLSLTALDAEHCALLAAEKESARALESRGEVPEATQAGYERLRKSYELLLRNASSLAEVLSREPPSYPEDNVTRLPGAAGGGEVGRLEALTGGGTGEGPFEDEEQRAFYESLPELRAMLPAVLLSAGDERGEAGEAAAEAGTPTEAPEAEAHPKAEEADKGPGSAALTALFARLASCVTRDACDAFSLDFCYLNSRAARRRLVRELASPRLEPQRLPYACRIAASLAAVMRDVGPPLLAAVEDEAGSLRGRKDAGACDARTRNATFVGELAKFKLAPPGLPLGLLKGCLDDFAGHNVDVAAALLEACGRFLCRSPESAVRANALVDILARMKAARNLDARQAALADGAFLACRPHQRAPLRKRKQRPPVHEFVRHCIFTLLAPGPAVERCVRLLRRMPWTAENEAYLLKCSLKVHKTRFTAVPAVAALLSGLARFHDSLGVCAVDDALEALRDGLEHNTLSSQQRRVAQARLLGELYNYRLLNSEGIFGALYLLLTHGYEQPPDAEQAPAWPACDPPEDCFRVRLVVTLLGACGAYFDRGAARAKLDRYLLYFQRYLLSKPQLPMDQAFDVADLLQALRPKMRRAERFADACAAVAAAEAAEAAQAAAQRGAETIYEEEEPMEEGSDEEGSLGEDEESEAEADAEADEAEAESSDEEQEEQTDGLAEESEDEEGRGRGASLVPPEEQDAFERELSACLGEPAAAGRPQAPASALRPMPRAGLPMLSLGARAARGGAAVEEGGPTVSFKMLTKREGRTRTRELLVPLGSEMAVTVAAQQEAEDAERSEMKRLVLGQLAASDAAAAEADAAANTPGRVLFSTGGQRGGDRYRRRHS